MDIRSHPSLAPIINTQHNILLMGMSGIGKSWLSQKLQCYGCWHYVSIDMEIQNKYLIDELHVNFNSQIHEAPVQFSSQNKAKLKLGNETQCGSLAPLTNFLSMPGNPEKGGIEFREYARRQQLHREAEINSVKALLTLKAEQPIIADMSGSFCEVINPNDQIVSDLRERFKFISLRENDPMISQLIDRYKKDPKPIYFPPDFLKNHWQKYTKSKQLSEQEVDPRSFMLWVYEKLVARRRTKYAAWLDLSGIKIDASDLQQEW